eukprot:12909550-Prorocentrum_lima.AAC.1
MHLVRLPRPPASIPRSLHQVEACMGTPCAARSVTTVAANQAGEERTQLFAEMRTPSLLKEAER